MNMLKRALLNLLVPALLALSALAFLACEDSDPVAIEGSTIILTATPNPIDLLADPTGTSIVEARLLSSTGVPQQDTSVFFSITSGSGFVSPEDDTTDPQGRAFTTLTATTPNTTITVTAQSGSISANRQVSVTEGTPTTHFLTATDNLISGICTDTATLSGTLSGTGGPISGQPVTFAIIATEVNGTAPSPALTGSFTPPTTLTDSSGSYTVTFRMDSTQCGASCVGANTCKITVRATAATLDSTPVPIVDDL